MTKRPEENLPGLGVKRLSSTELEYMKVIWQYPEGISSEIIYQLFSKHTEATRRVVLFKIAEKGYIETMKAGRHRIYRAKIGEEEYAKAVEEREFNKKYGTNSLEHVVAAFCGKETLSAEQLRRLNELLEDIKNGADHT